MISGTVRIALVMRHQRADPPCRDHLLRARRERPRGRTAEKRDELASFYA